MNMKITLAVVSTIVVGITGFFFLNRNDSSTLANSSLVENTSAEISAEKSAIPAEEETALEVATTSVNIEVEGMGTVAFNGEYVDSNASYEFSIGSDAILTIDSGDNEVEIIANGISLVSTSEYDLNSLAMDTLDIKITFTEVEAEVEFASVVVETPVVIVETPVIVEAPAENNNSSSSSSSVSIWEKYGVVSDTSSSGSTGLILGEAPNINSYTDGEIASPELLAELTQARENYVNQFFADIDEEEKAKFLAVDETMTVESAELALHMLDVYTNPDTPKAQYDWR